MKTLTLIFICILSAGHPVNAIHGDTVIRFKNLVGNKELRLFTDSYTDSFGEPFVVNKFKYYISNLSVSDKTGNQINSPEQYYLINEEDSLSKEIHLPAVSGISAISFMIGVDSLENISGVQTGSLDPANGMFWTWNSGYIFAKLEGQSDSSHAAAHSFSWDVGGFRQQQNALRMVRLVINENSELRNNGVTVGANLLKWFDGNTKIHISNTPVCHQPGKLALQIADNYSSMFFILP